MSKVDVARKQREDEEEKKKKEVTGQQQKTQSDSNKPTGTTSIPKDNQGVNGRTQESTASSLRTEGNTTTVSGTPQREESKQNIIRRNTITANKQEDSNDWRRGRSKAPDQDQYKKNTETKSKKNEHGNKDKSGTLDFNEQQDNERRRNGLERMARNQNLLDDVNSLPMAPGSGMNQLSNLDEYTQKNPNFDFTGKETIGSRKNAENDLANILYNRDKLREDAARDTSTLNAFLSGAGSTGFGLLGDLANLGEMIQANDNKKDQTGMTPDEIYDRAMSNAPSSIFNYSGKDMKSDYDAYKEYILNQMESGDVTPDEIQKMKNLEEAFSRSPGHFLNEANNDFRAMNEGFAQGHEIANMAGSLAPLMAENIALGPMTESAGAAASAINNPLTRAAAIQGANLIPDVLTDTLPEVARNINEDATTDKILSDAAKNLALNEIANLGFEYAPKAFKAIGNKLNGSNTAKRVTEEAVPEVAEQIAKNVDDATPSIPDLTGNPYLDIPELSIANNANRAIGNDLSPLRDDIIERIAKNGGDNGDALSNLIRSGDAESLSYFDQAMKDYNAATGGMQAKQLDRLNDILNGRIPEGLDAQAYGNILNSIDTIEDGLNRISNLEGLSNLGRTHLNSAYDALNAYEDAVRNGGDANAAAKELSRILGNLDNQAKKVEGYDGIFSQWKGGGTARGDLFSNTNQIRKPLSDDIVDVTPEEAQELTDLYDFGSKENQFARPANTLSYEGNNISSPSSAWSKSSAIHAPNGTAYNSNIVPDSNKVNARNMVPGAEDLPQNVVDTNLQHFANEPTPNIPETDIPKVDNGRYGQRRTVTNTGINSEIVTKEQLQNDPIIQDIARYQKHSNELSLAEAMDNVSLNGETWKNDIISGARPINSDVAVDTTMLLMRDLDRQIATATDDATKELLTAQKNDLLRKLASNETNYGQIIQALAKWNNTSDGAMLTATKVQQNDVIKPWISKNQKAAKGNSRIAKALAGMGDDTKVVKGAKEPLTHEQIKQGVIAEIEKEYGSIENRFNDNDIEFLTQMAEDKKIPIWQITDEIEHKFNTGDWYTLDESVEMPKYTNQKLNNALNALFEEGGVRQSEPVQKSLDQIREEVKNTLEKEAASFNGEFTDSDIDYLANLINNGSTKQELADALNTKMATGSFGISAETQQQVNDLFKQAQLYDPDSKQFVECQAEALRLLAEEVAPNATPLEKFETWRYMAMLGNPKTMLRNYVGNKMFGIVTGISNNMAAIAEEGVDRASKALGGEGIQRTKSVLNPISDKRLIDASALDADNSRYRQMMGSKYEKVDKETLKQHRSVFKSKLGRLAEKAVDAGISDYSAIKKKYSTSLAGYLKANGYDASIFDADTQLRRLKNLEQTQILSAADKRTMEELTEKVSKLEQAREYALKQAEYATFHEDNAFASWLTNISQNAPGVGHAIIEGVVPFKKTPANVLKSGIEYSPLGAIDSIKKTGKLIYENTGKRAGNLADTYFNSKGKEVTKTLASDVIESWSKTLTGAGLTGLGAYLFDKGILQSSNNDTKYQDQLEGLQNYSIKINGKTYTIDWAAPAVMPVLLGAEIKKVWDSAGETSEKWYENLDEYLSAANRIADPLVEMSFLQGISDTIETAANAVKNNDFMSIPAMIGYNAATGYLQQAIPTLGGQIARTIDNTRRSTYTDKEGVAGVLEKQGKKLMNKIPFLSEQNEPYIDTYGREQRNSPTDNPLINFAYQSLSPGYIADVNTTKADEISRDLYNKTGDDNILPAWQSSLKIDGKRVSPEKYTEFARVYGETNYNVRDSLVNDEWFNSLSDDRKADILHDVNNLAKNVGQAAVNEEFTSSSKPYKAYSEGGIDGLIQYYRNEDIKDAAKAFDDGNGSLNQSEKLAYLNTLNSDEEVMAAWDLLKGKSNKTPQKNENGEWELVAPKKAESGKSSKKAETKTETKAEKKSTSQKTNNSDFMTGNQTMDVRIKAKQKAQQEAKAKKTENAIPEVGGSWSVESNGKTYDLKKTKTYQRAQSAGWSDSDFLKHFHGADADHGGTITKSEAKAYIDALEGLTRQEKHDMFEILRTRKSKNPY